jgi:O-antigen/teichoic acid export membrane protein
MSKPLEITGNLLTRNWIFNLVGQFLPLIFAVAATPYVIKGLGAERFGILSIAWGLLSYTAVLDLGLSRATTKFAAECLARGESEQLSAIVRVSLQAQIVLGVIGTIILALATPVLVGHILKLSAALVQETKLAFLILALSLPIVLSGNVFRGILEAGQRFDLVNLVRMPANASIFLLPAFAVLVGLHLPGIVCLLVFARLGASVAYLVLCLLLYPVIRYNPARSPHLIRMLLGYGRWVAISNFLEPLLTYVDRFFIGAMLSVTFVAYYTAPYDAITRTWVIPSSLTATVFPAFSSLSASRADKSLEELCVRSLKSLLVSLGPILLLVIFFARDILTLWLGSDFAAKSTVVLQILAVGVLANSLAFVPVGLLHGLGRPDLTAKIHLLELPFYLAMLAFCIAHMGIVGAAIAWTARVCLDAISQFAAVLWLRVLSADILTTGLVKSLAAVCTFGVLLAQPWLARESSIIRTLIAGTELMAFCVVTWKYVLDNRDRNLVISASNWLRAALRMSA